MHKCYVIESFQKPNFFVDIFSPLLKNGEYKALDAIIRDFFGSYYKLRAWLREDIDKAQVSYQKIKKLTGMNYDAVSAAIKGLLKYKILIQTRNSRDPKGAAYLLNIPPANETIKIDGKTKVTRLHCSCRMMDIEGLKQRKRQGKTAATSSTAEARKAKADKLMTDAAKLAVQKAIQRKNSERNSSEKQMSNSSEKQMSSYIIKTQKDLKTHQSENTLTHSPNPNPNNRPIDPKTGKQIPVSAWMRGKFPKERQIVFNYLEYTLKKDERVQKDPPKQDFYIFLDSIIDTRKFLSLWELQQFTLGILLDKNIEKPTAAMRMPEKFSTEYYIALYQKSHENGQRRPKVETQVDIDKLWNDVLKKLEKRVNRPSFNTWIKPSMLSEMTRQDGNGSVTAKISVPDEVFVYWLGEYYTDLIQNALSESLGFQSEISFWVDLKLGDETVVQEAQAAARQAGAPT